MYVCVNSHFSLARVLHPPYELVQQQILFNNYASNIVRILLLEAVMNLGRLQVKRSYRRYHKHRHSACCLLVCIQLSSPCLAVPPPKQAKFIAGLTTHSFLVLHTSLQGKLAALPGWYFWGFFVYWREKG